MISSQKIRSALESMLYVWGRPLPAKDAGEVLGLTEEETRRYFDQLQEEYEREERGLRIRKIGNSYQFVTPEENSEYIRILATPVKVKKLSQAALEVLAVIAYRQPVTKGVIDQIRGVKCDRVVEGLVDKGLVTARGRSDGPGRPALYVTTERFLEYMGFSSLDDLPDIQDIENAAEQEEMEEEQLSLAIVQEEI